MKSMIDELLDLSKRHQRRWSMVSSCRLGRLLPILTVLLICFLGAGGLAQQTTGDIVGTVTDATGSAIPNATVTITNLGTHDIRTAQSSESGEYVFNLLNPGDYSVTVFSAGFSRLNVPKVTLLAGDRARVNAPLAIGGANETVTVEAAAPALQTDDSSVSSTVTEKAVQELPLNGRNFVSLTQTLPGATEGRIGGLNSGSQADDRRQTSSISVNGQGSILNNQEIDGMDNNEKLIGTIGVRPSIEAISELRVQAANYTADSGRTGGGVVNVITKAGTNNFHGSIFEFLRNDKLNTNAFAFGAINPIKPELRQNQFGGALGGRLIRDRMFFFGDYEGFRIVNQTNPTTLTVPTLYEHNHPGDFTDIGGKNLNLTPASIDPVGATYFSFYPAPNVGTNQYLGVAKNTQTSDAFDVRVDYKLNDHDSMFARTSYNKVLTNTTGTFPQVTVGTATFFPNINIATSPDKAVNSQLNYVHIFNSNLLMELKGGYTYIDNSSAGSTNANVNQMLGQQNVNFLPGLSYVTVSAASTLDNGGAFVPLTDLDNTYQVLGSVNWTVGHHNVKFGSGLIRRQNTSAQSNYPNGNWNFNTLQDLYQGSYTSVTRVASLINPHLRSWEDTAYVQDDWRFSPTLTLNLGLRYDVFTPFVETQNRIANFDDLHGRILVANAADRQVGVKNDFTNLSPRIGFADTVRPSLVVRGAYALVFFPTNTTSTATFKTTPFTSTYGPVGPSAAFPRFSAGLPQIAMDSATNPTGSLGDTVSTLYQSSQLHQFNLGVQQDFRGNTVSILYVGSVGRHMPQIIPDINAAPPNAAPGAVYQTLRPFYATLPNLKSVQSIRTEGVSYYNALQIVYERRLRKGLYVNTNLTYAHNLDSMAGGVDGTAKPLGNGSLPLMENTRDYGNSTLDVRVRATTLINYSLPFGQSLHGFAAAAGKGWQVNTLNIWSTSPPFTVVNAQNVDGARQGVATSDRPNQVGSTNLPNHGIAQFFRTAAFPYDPSGTNPTDGAQRAGQLGNEAIASLYGPHFRHLDVSLFKDFPVYRESTLQFRAEVFNIFNMANFAFPNASLNGANFGKITATSANYTPRLIQFALKYQF